MKQRETLFIAVLIAFIIALLFIFFYRLDQKEKRAVTPIKTGKLLLKDTLHTVKTGSVGYYQGIGTVGINVVTYTGNAPARRTKLYIVDSATHRVIDSFTIK